MSLKRYRRDVGGSGSGEASAPNAEHFQHQAGIGAEFTQRGGDIADVQETQTTDGHGAQPSQCAQDAAFARAAAIFAKGAAARVMQRFNLPVAAVQFQQLHGKRLRTRQVGDQIDRLLMGIEIRLIPMIDVVSQFSGMPFGCSVVSPFSSPTTS